MSLSSTDAQKYFPSTSVKSFSLIAYFLLAYFLSWTIMIPLALKKNGIINCPLPFSLHYLAAYGPFLSAVIITAATSGKSGLRKIFRGIFMWKVKLVWWLIVISPFIIYLFLSSLNYLITGSFYNFNLLGDIKFIPNFGAGAFLVWLLTYGLGEETGWRGFALPIMQKDRSALSATVTLWIFWSLWHLPAFFYLYDTAILIPFLIGQFAGAIIFTWLFNSTSGSTLIVIVFHGVFNFLTASKGGEGILAAMLSTIVIIGALLVLLICKPANLSKQGKVIF